MKLQIGLQRLAEDCGFQHLLPHVWVQHVTAVVPNDGFWLDWPEAWQEVAPGVPYGTLWERSTDPTRLLDLVNNKLKRDQVRMMCKML